MQPISLSVNGRTVNVIADTETPLLDILRNHLGLKGTKFGCGQEQCGCCMVLVDGRPEKSCGKPLSTLAGKQILTIEGLGTPEHPHPLQTAYVEEQVPQCGYCINGWIMTAAAFLQDKKKPTEDEIKQALTGLKCRCGTHLSILRAVKRAADMMA